MQSSQKRDSFKSRAGFIWACVGSAVGMGNIWLFPYRVGQLGGAAFLIPYFIAVALLGYSGVIEEMAFGRAMRSGPIGAFEKVMSRRGLKGGAILGYIPVVGALGIAVGYSVVVGWIIKFFVQSTSGLVTSAPDSGAFFGAVAGPMGSLGWHTAAILLTLFVMAAGVSRGIERLNKAIMPLFFLMFALLALRVAFLPGALDGYKFLVHPDFQVLWTPKTWVYALGQAFFSLSIAGSGTLVYGSYLKDDVDIVSSAKSVAFFDTVAALLAAVVILPATFAHQVAPTAGPPLMFIVMPEIFKGIPASALFCTIFFFAALCAGLTSLVNLYEAPIEALQNRFGLSRAASVAVITLAGLALGIALEDGARLGAWMDLISIYVLPLGALLAAVMFFWIGGSGFAADQIRLGRNGNLSPLIVPLGKYVFCGLTILVFVMGIRLGGIG